MWVCWEWCRRLLQLPLWLFFVCFFVFLALTVYAFFSFPLGKLFPLYTGLTGLELNIQGRVSNRGECLGPLWYALNVINTTNSVIY